MLISSILGDSTTPGDSAPSPEKPVNGSMPSLQLWALFGFVVAVVLYIGRRMSRASRDTTGYEKTLA